MDKKGLNIVIVIIDSIRQDHIGVYGNKWIKTPNLDKFAKESITFTDAYPESLPTLPVRRAIHTGIRTFPFASHKFNKGDFNSNFKVAPGWGPIPEEQDTISELLRDVGYRTAFVTDTYHQFKPSKNFHRGFDEWVWVRGQEGDMYKSSNIVSDKDIISHMPDSKKGNVHLFNFISKYLNNNYTRKSEEDYLAPQVFIEASNWVFRNKDAEKFFLVVDSFDPHEPWDPPVYYRRLYDPKDDCKNDVIHSSYGKWTKTYTKRELKRLQANYAGEVSMVDRWFGNFIDTLEYTGKLEDTIVAVISDHGHNVGYPEDKDLLGKCGYPMTPAVAHLLLMIRHPKGMGKGTFCNKLVYNHDLTPTLLSMSGVGIKHNMHGRNFWPVNKGKNDRKHITIGWGPYITVISNRWWYNATIWGKEPLLYEYKKDKKLGNNVAKKYPEVCKRMLKNAIDDAGGEIPAHMEGLNPNPGCTPLL